MKEPAWLTSLADQRMALFEDKAAALIGAAQPHFIMTFLTEPDEDTPAALEHWEHSCTNCRAFRPGQLYPGMVRRTMRNGVEVIMTFDVCEECRTTSD